MRSVRLVYKGYKQKEGVDYAKVYAPVTRIEIVQLLILLATTQMVDLSNGCEVDILNEILKEEVYIEQSLRHMRRQEEKKVLRLKKAMYEL